MVGASTLTWSFRFFQGLDSHFRLLSPRAVNTALFFEHISCVNQGKVGWSWAKRPETGMIRLLTHNPAQAPVVKT